MTNDFTRFHGRLQIIGELELQTPLRIGSGGGDETSIADIAVVKDAMGRPYIPGSSFKGVLRSTIEQLLRTVDESLACLCVTNQDNHRCPTTKKRHKEEGQDKSDYKSLLEDEFDNDEDAMYLEGTCRVCQVFGSLGLASKVTIPDLYLSEEWSDRYQVRYGVSIDRDTETAADSRLYTTQAVPPGTRFHCEVIIENGSQADQGMVLLGLRAFEHSLVAMGGAASRGLG
ncbi:MAG: CRISPR-associated RAMP protein, partial [Chloroflexi bacterium]|nr:CRISPR-associated RAMP protein [Chloroflexota bacterium]